jgi:hypothetical protein
MSSWQIALIAAALAAVAMLVDHARAVRKTHATTT